LLTNRPWVAVWSCLSAGSPNTASSARRLPPALSIPSIFDRAVCRRPAAREGSRRCAAAPPMRRSPVRASLFQRISLESLCIGPLPPDANRPQVHANCTRSVRCYIGPYAQF